METQAELIERKIMNTRHAALAFIRRELEERLEPQFVTLVGGDHDGAKVVSLDGVRNAVAIAFATELPAHDMMSAEVVTPAIIFVDVRCPRCKEVGRITATLAAELRVTATDSELHIKAKASKVGHTCGQLTVVPPIDEEEEPDPEAEAAIAQATEIVNAEPADEEEAPPEKPKRSRRRKPEPVDDEPDVEPDKGYAGGAEPSTDIKHEWSEDQLLACPFPGCTFPAEHEGAHSPTTVDELPPDED